MSSGQSQGAATLLPRDVYTFESTHHIEASMHIHSVPTVPSRLSAVRVMSLAGFVRLTDLSNVEAYVYA